MRSYEYMGCVCICFYQLLHCIFYATATPEASSGFKDIYLEAPGSDIDVFIPLLEQASDNLRTYVKVKRPFDKSNLGKLGNENISDQKKIERSDSIPNKDFSRRFFFNRHPPLPPHPPTRHYPPAHPPRPHHGPKKHPSKPHHGPPKHKFYPLHFDHGPNNIFDTSHDFDFEPPHFMNQESDFPYVEDFFEEQDFNPEPPKPDSFIFPSDEHDRPPPHHEHDRPPPHHKPYHQPHHPPSHSPPHPPPQSYHHSSHHFPHPPSHINFITEENIYRGDVPFKETHNERDRIHPGLDPAGVKGLDPRLVAFINQSSRLK